MSRGSELAVTDHTMIIGSIERETAALLSHVLSEFLEIDLQGEPLLAGLTGGHILTHLSRESDRMADQLLAATGQVVPTPDPDRQWPVEQGGLRPGAVLIEDFVESSDRLRAALVSVTDWSQLDAAARAVPGQRLVQLVMHHADLKRPWSSVPEDDAVVAVAQLSQVLAAELAGIRLTAVPAAPSLQVATVDGETLIEGDPRDLLAWASGRPASTDTTTAGLPDVGGRVWF